MTNQPLKQADNLIRKKRYREAWVTLITLPQNKRRQKRLEEINTLMRSASPAHTKISIRPGPASNTSTHHLTCPICYSQNSKDLRACPARKSDACYYTRTTRSRKPNIQAIITASVMLLFCLAVLMLNVRVSTGTSDRTFDTEFAVAALVSFLIILWNISRLFQSEFTLTGADLSQWTQHVSLSGRTNTVAYPPEAQDLTAYAHQPQIPVSLLLVTEAGERLLPKIGQYSRHDIRAMSPDSRTPYLTLISLVLQGALTLYISPIYTQSNASDDWKQSHAIYFKLGNPSAQVDGALENAIMAVARQANAAWPLEARTLILGAVRHANARSHEINRSIVQPEARARGMPIVGGMVGAILKDFIVNRVPEAQHQGIIGKEAANYPIEALQAHLHAFLDVYTRLADTPPYPSALKSVQQSLKKAVEIDRPSD